MKTTIRKIFWVWDFEKEEQWLDKMAQQGLALVSVGFCRYTFEPCAPNEYSVRMELLEHLPSHRTSQDYIAFMTETGAEYLGTCTRWAYFRQKTTRKPFELYSDNPSRIKHLNRILCLMRVVLGLNVFAVGMNVFAVRQGSPASLVFCAINAIIAGMLIWGIVQLKDKRANMKQNVFE